SSRARARRVRGAVGEQWAQVGHRPLPPAWPGAGLANYPYVDSVAADPCLAAPSRAAGGERPRLRHRVAATCLRAGAAAVHLPPRRAAHGGAAVAFCGPGRFICCGTSCFAVTATCGRVGNTRCTTARPPASSLATRRDDRLAGCGVATSSK